MSALIGALMKRPSMQRASSRRSHMHFLRGDDYEKRSTVHELSVNQSILRLPADVLRSVDERRPSRNGSWVERQEGKPNDA